MAEVVAKQVNENDLALLLQQHNHRLVARHADTAGVTEVEHHYAWGTAAVVVAIADLTYEQVENHQQQLELVLQSANL